MIIINLEIKKNNRTPYLDRIWSGETYIEQPAPIVAFYDVLLVNLNMTSVFEVRLTGAKKDMLQFDNDDTLCDNLYELKLKKEDINMIEKAVKEKIIDIHFQNIEADKLNFAL